MQAIEDRIQYVPRSSEDAKLYQVIQDFYRDTYWVLVSSSTHKGPLWLNGKLGNIVRLGTQAGALRALGDILCFKEP